MKDFTWQENIRCTLVLHYLPSVSPKQIFFLPVFFFQKCRHGVKSPLVYIENHFERDPNLVYPSFFLCKLLFLSSQSRHFTAISFYRSLSQTPKSLSLNQRHTDRPARCVSVYCPETAICFHDAVIFSFSLSVKIYPNSYNIKFTTSVCLYSTNFDQLESVSNKICQASK